MLLNSHSTVAGRVRPVSDSAYDVVRLSIRAMCARLQQYVALQRLQLHSAAWHRMVVLICR
ncbi:hypothetical protein XpopCFBP1817_02740 [Xanthomonas populi]|uniref:Uncharacterized protein n=1 Tax=Xanthomonas populi TaxID=53414 RepID=A0A2S7F296_9XANT|nr:hypothetical protein [Xanthomonas populi]PPU99551.1 hypothetical protein XpopCFBP1817_02740 [Xanthomonas populi]